jgi:hypothetical protein
MKSAFSCAHTPMRAQFFLSLGIMTHDPASNMLVAYVRCLSYLLRIYSLKYSSYCVLHQLQSFETQHNPQFLDRTEKQIKPFRVSDPGKFLLIYETLEIWDSVSYETQTINLSHNSFGIHKDFVKHLQLNSFLPTVTPPMFSRGLRTAPLPTN